MSTATPIGLIQDMVKLSRNSTRGLASICALSQPNLVAGLQGQRSLPADKLAVLIDALGMEADRLKPDQLHLWKIGSDLAPLEHALRVFMPDGGTIAGLWREGKRGMDFSRSFDKQMFALFDERNLIVLMRTGLGTHSLLAKKIGPETLPGFSWLGSGVGADLMVRLPQEIFSQLQGGIPVPISVMRQLLGSTPEINWEDVLQVLQRDWHTPREAMEALAAIRQEPSR